MENRTNTLKAKTVTTGVVAQKPQGPSLRPRAVLGDLTKTTAVNTNQIRNEQAGKEELKKPALGAAVKKTLQPAM